MRGVAVYVILTFSMAWIAWAIAWFSGAAPDNILKFQIAILPGSFAPALSACIVRKWVTHEGFADAGLNFSPRRWGYYLFALLLPFGVVGVIVLLSVTVGASTPDWSVKRALHVLTVGMPLSGRPPTIPSKFWLILPAVLLAQSVLVTPILWGEEFGWRGYLQTRLFPREPLHAAVCTGFIWGVWHYPLILMRYQYPGNPFIGLMIFPVTAILLSVIFGWLRIEAGSVWPACVAHAATNAVGGSSILLLFSGGPNWILVSYMGVFGWLPLGAVCAWIVLTGRLRPDQSVAVNRG